MHGNGKGSKRKALEMGRKFDQEWRIVSVSRLTGGKDRHSKVLTTKGLRDRRVRLSLPTAIQLYDLQERLGYEQPSKAIDWLIKAAKSAIDELPVLDPQISSPSAGNVAPSNSSNYSNVDHCVVSSGESATAVNAPALTALKVGVGSGTAKGRNFRKAINAKATSITTQKGSDLVRSSSSISDGSTKGSVEHMSNSSMSEPNYMIEPRLKAYELGIEKFISDKTSGGSTPAVHQMNSMQPFLTSCLFNNPYPYSVLPFESQGCKDNNPCGIHTQILSRIGNVQQLWDYNNRPSYMDMLYTQESQLFRNLASSSTAPVQKSFPPVQSTLASIRDLTGTSSLQSYEKADSAISFFDPEQSRPFGGNAEQAHNFVPIEDYKAHVFEGFHYAGQRKA